MTQPQAMEEQLRASEVRFRAVFENCPDGIIIADEQTKGFVACNAAASQMLGYAPEEITSLGVAHLHPADAAPDVADQFEKLARGEINQTVDIPVKRKDGTVFRAEIRAFPITLAGRNCVAGLFRDISERQRAAAALQESEARYRELVENQGEGLGVVDPEERFTFVNPAGEQIFGVPPGGLAGRTLKEFLTPAQYARVLEETRHRRAGQKSTYELEIVRPDGETRCLLITAAPRTDTAGQYLGAFGLFRDITEHRRAEQRVREREEIERALLNAVQESLFLLDPQGVMLATNETNARRLGVSAEEMVGRSIYDFLPLELAGAYKAQCEKAIGERCPVHFEDVRAGRHFESFLYPVVDAQGNATMLAVYAFDITGRKHAEEQLRKLSRAVEQSPASVVVTDREGCIEYVNAKFVQTTGYSFDEVRGQNPRIFQSGETPPETYAQLWQTITRGDEWRGEFHNRKENGELFWEDVSISPVVDKVGFITHFIAIKEDVSERKLAAARLAASEQQFRTLFESAPVAMALHGANGRYLQVNQAYQEMLGYSLEELLRLGPKRVTHPEDVPEGRRRYGELCEGQRDHYWREKRYVRKDGRLVWGRSANAALRSPTGHLDYIISVVEDITAQKRAAECTAAFARLGLELSASTTSKEAAHIVASTASGLFGWDACYVHLHASERDEIQPVLTMDTLDGCRREVPPVNPTGRTPLMVEVMQCGARLINRDASGANAPASIPLVPFGDKSRPSASIMCVPIRHGAKVVGVLSIQSYTPQAYREEDVNLLQILADHCGGASERVQAAAERKRLEEEIVEISAREQRRIGFELHDGLGQTLGGIALKAKLLEQTLREEHLPHAPDVAALVKLLNRAMGDTRRLARGLAPTELELSGLPGAIELMGHEIEASTGIRCLVTCHPPDLQLRPVVALHLYRIVQEALHNAIQHGQPRQIEVALTAEKLQLCLRVRDDGKGLASNVPARSGMGLNIMRYRADAISGELTVLSRPNRGTEIRCVLPDITRWEAGSQKASVRDETKPSP